MCKSRPCHFNTAALDNSWKQTSAERRHPLIELCPASAHQTRTETSVHVSGVTYSGCLEESSFCITFSDLPGDPNESNNLLENMLAFFFLNIYLFFCWYIWLLHFSIRSSSALTVTNWLTSVRTQTENMRQQWNVTNKHKITTQNKVFARKSL